MALLLAGSFAFGGTEATVWAQQVENPSLASTADLQALLERGETLERQRQWSDALSLYEDALQTFPNHQTISQRLTRAKVHYSVARRYADRSYVDSLRTLGEQDALSLYEEVLQKLNTHYVDEVRWSDLYTQGTQAMLVAVETEPFAKQNLQGASPEWTRAFQQELSRQGADRTIRSQYDLIEAVRAAGRSGRRQMGVAPTAIIMEYLYHSVSTLDPYSTYLTGGQLDELYHQIDGNFVGLGVELKEDPAGLLVVNVISGSPAEKGGLQAGERILTIDGDVLRGQSIDQAAAKLQGPRGSVVTVTVAGSDNRSRELRLRRDEIEVPSIDSVKIIDAASGLGYLRLTSFQKTTPRELDAALWQLHRLGMRSLVMDLRGNPGGLLTTSVEVADRFIAEGRIVSTRGRSPDQNWTYSAHQPGTWRTPLFVLIDQDSASAAEIFAGAIRDHGRGTLIGKTSYGKGSVQSIFSLGQARAGLRLTTAKFYSPNGLPFAHIGVRPDIEVHQVARPAQGEQIELNRDPTITTTIQQARNYFYAPDAQRTAASR
jgi:carboxyl-terminal processing protease